MIVYALNKPLDCQKICFDIQKLIDRSNQSEPGIEKALVISLQNITEAVVKPRALEYNTTVSPT